MRPVLFFVATREQARQLGEAMECPYVTGAMPLTEREDAILKFIRREVPKIVCTINSMAIGWNAPNDTLIVFMEGCQQEGPLRRQAELRGGARITRL